MPAPCKLQRNQKTKLYFGKDLLKRMPFDVVAHVRLHHHRAQLFERRLWLPTELCLRARGVADQQVDLGWAVELGIDAN